jgi:hypothetical protein
MAVTAVNYMEVPEGISATLLVFGVIPSFGALGDPKLPKYATRSSALQKATTIATEFNAKKAVHNVLANSSVPDIMEIERLKTLPPGSSIRAYREKEGWIQCKLLRVRGHQVEFLLPSGRKSSATIAAVRAMNAETNSLPINLLSVMPQFKSPCCRVDNFIGLFLLLLQQASKAGCGTRTRRSRILAYICILMILHLEIQGQATLAAIILI